MPGRIGAGILLVGILALLIGLFLLALERREEGGINTQWGTFVGPVWFILIIFGIVLMAAGILIPF